MARKLRQTALGSRLNFLHDAGYESGGYKVVGSTC